MMLYVLICLCLSLAGVAGLQFFYLIYLERVDREHRKHIRELEHHCQFLSKRLKDSEMQISEQSEMIEAFYEDFDEEEEEVWADVIDER
jgi:hypothetical protein